MLVVIVVVVGGGAVPSDLMYITSVNPFIYSVWSWRKKGEIFRRKSVVDRSVVVFLLFFWKCAR